MTTKASLDILFPLGNNRILEQVLDAEASTTNTQGLLDRLPSSVKTREQEIIRTKDSNVVYAHGAMNHIVAHGQLSCMVCATCRTARSAIENLRRRCKRNDVIRLILRQVWVYLSNFSAGLDNRIRWGVETSNMIRYADLLHLLATPRVREYLIHKLCKISNRTFSSMFEQTHETEGGLSRLGLATHLLPGITLFDYRSMSVIIPQWPRCIPQWAMQCFRQQVIPRLIEAVIEEAINLENGHETKKAFPLAVHLRCVFENIIHNINQEMESDTPYDVTEEGVSVELLAWLIQTVKQHSPTLLSQQLVPLKHMFSMKSKLALFDLLIQHADLMIKDITFSASYEHFSRHMSVELKAFQKCVLDMGSDRIRSFFHLLIEKNREYELLCYMPEIKPPLLKDLWDEVLDHDLRKFDLRPHVDGRISKRHSNELPRRNRLHLPSWMRTPDTQVFTLPHEREPSKLIKKLVGVMLTERTRFKDSVRYIMETLLAFGIFETKHAVRWARTVLRLLGTESLKFFPSRVIMGSSDFRELIDTTCANYRYAIMYMDPKVKFTLNEKSVDAEAKDRNVSMAHVRRDRRLFQATGFLRQGDYFQDTADD